MQFGPGIQYTIHPPLFTLRRQIIQQQGDGAGENRDPPEQIPFFFQVDLYVVIIDEQYCPIRNRQKLGQAAKRHVPDTPKGAPLVIGTEKAMDGILKEIYLTLFAHPLHVINMRIKLSEVMDENDHLAPSGFHELRDGIKIDIETVFQVIEMIRYLLFL